MIVTRFAPSPTGFLHLGHAYAAWYAWNRARAAQGRFLLRMEDIDRTRCNPELAVAILEDLKWLGLHWDGEIRYQSQHLADYQTALHRLAKLSVIYPCFCSRKDIQSAVSAPHGPEGPVYPGTCRTLSPDQVAARKAKGGSFALRLDVAKAEALTGPLWFQDDRHGRIQAKPGSLGDVVLARRDAPASYHLCVTIDDEIQGVSLVTRGEDLLRATHIHRLLQALLGFRAPHYSHHRLVLNDAGQRLSKRDDALSIGTLRRAGRSAAEVLALAGVPQMSAPTGLIPKQDQINSKTP